MKIVAVYNIKGGVGKTATAVNLAYLSAQEGHRTLLWDLDPQAASTYYFRIKPEVKGRKALLRGERGLDSAVKGTDFDGLDLLPAEFSMRKMDLLLEGQKGSAKRLLRLLRPQSESYDRVLLDCPPSVSLVSENVFRAADALLVPIVPTTLCARTLEQLFEFLEAEVGKQGPLVLPFFSMVDRRKRLHLDLMERLPARYGGFLQSTIPAASEVERMGVHRMPLPAYAPSSPLSESYRSLMQELERRLAGEPGGADAEPARTG